MMPWISYGIATFVPSAFQPWMVFTVRFSGGRKLKLHASDERDIVKWIMALQVCLVVGVVVPLCGHSCVVITSTNDIWTLADMSALFQAHYRLTHRSAPVYTAGKLLWQIFKAKYRFKVSSYPTCACPVALCVSSCFLRRIPTS